MAESIITVAKTETDQWGNLIVTTTLNQKVKINKKRENLFPLFQQGKTISLDYQTYMNKQYVADAKEVAGEAVKEIRTPADLPKEGKIIPEMGKSGPPEIAPQERGMWWKELGESLRSGLIDKEKPHGAQLKTAYISEMLRVLNIKLETKPKP